MTQLVAPVGLVISGKMTKEAALLEAPAGLPAHRTGLVKRPAQVPLMPMVAPRVAWPVTKVT